MEAQRLPGRVMSSEAGPAGGGSPAEQPWPCSNARLAGSWHRCHLSHAGDEEKSLPPTEGEGAQGREPLPPALEKIHRLCGHLSHKEEVPGKAETHMAGDGFPQAASPVSSAAAPRSGWIQPASVLPRRARLHSPPLQAQPSPTPSVAGVPPPPAPSLHRPGEMASGGRGGCLPSQGLESFLGEVKGGITEVIG